MQPKERAGGGGRQSVHQCSFLVGGEFSVCAKRWLRACPHACRIAAACGIQARRAASRDGRFRGASTARVYVANCGDFFCLSGIMPLKAEALPSNVKN
jgi:hypothetical protein